MKKYIIVDCKNFPFYSSGISGYFKPFLKASIQYFNEYTFVLTSPAKFDTNFLDGLTNYECCIIPNLKFNFNFLNILIYDLYIYPKALKKINGIMLLSPYYDFIIPKCYKDKAIITVHDLCYWEVGNCYSLKVKLYHKFLLYINSSRAKKIITVSKTSLFYIKKYFNNEILKKCKIIYNVFEPPKNNNLSIHNVNLKKKIILYTGGYEQRKNIELLFKVLNDLKHEIDFELVFTGNFNNNNSLIQLIDNYELNNIVKLTGIIDTQELKNLYLKCDIVINLSLCEGFGRSNLEAIIYNKPLVCSDIKVFRELVKDYPIYCNPYCLSSVKDAIKLSFIPKIKKDINLDLNRFSLDRNRKDFINLLHEVLNA